MRLDCAKFACLSALASMLATVAATLLYIALIFHERSLSALLSGFFFGISLGIRGLLLAAIAGVFLFFVRNRSTGLLFVLVAILTSALAGALLGFWSTRNSPHINSSIAAGLLASTWAMVATAAALWAARDRFVADR